MLAIKEENLAVVSRKALSFATVEVVDKLELKAGDTLKEEVGVLKNRATRLLTGTTSAELALAAGYALALAAEYRKREEKQ